MDVDSLYENLNIYSSIRDKFDFLFNLQYNSLNSCKENLNLKDFFIIFIKMIIASLLKMKPCGKGIQLNSCYDLKYAARDGNSVICEGEK